MNRNFTLNLIALAVVAGGTSTVYRLYANWEGS